MPKEEKKFETKIRNYLENELGAWGFKYWAGSQFTKAGIPDLVYCLSSHFVAIEVKAQNGRPSELQLHNIRKIRNAGGMAFVVYPSGYEKLVDILNNLKLGYFSDDEEEILK